MNGKKRTAKKVAQNPARVLGINDVSKSSLRDVRRRKKANQMMGDEYTYVRMYVRLERRGKFCPKLANPTSYRSEIKKKEEKRWIESHWARLLNYASSISAYLEWIRSDGPSGWQHDEPYAFEEHEKVTSDFIWTFQLLICNVRLNFKLRFCNKKQLCKLVFFLLLQNSQTFSHLNMSNLLETNLKTWNVVNYLI